MREYPTSDTHLKQSGRTYCLGKNLQGVDKSEENTLSQYMMYELTTSEVQNGAGAGILDVICEGAQCVSRG